ncbi:DUF881 domain-containing protein [Salisediminibacterium halotolerans]|uniref:DUF881 domain-containing protein n=1 Tax=Salisediminibacterium halotolerans TaxID=517425 RepID=UPI000EAFDE87|nr:DUF881 domain-containing protein [Salisediminibacterium halotolerans]RLJ74303.1 uncharacterized protein YlxW (UPF0749 family) [Actinophytocola xinjiangensis]RPE87604.1 uncharacterized protein YlxW (UPF0749 family) [Salisediminibacterium halotolerans]TWG35140.1 uncharacterized protein YlxW (UPF0749 family) [Salisediminibacterium halotolerans]GEL07301.1 hypothetical protein SHA02_07170 [Salisediminibacterium halotolerans]
MNNKSLVIISAFTLITAGTALLLFMSADSEPQAVETRDTAELQEDLLDEKDRRQKLNDELAHLQEVYNQFQEEEDPELVMDDVLNDLKRAAGVTEVSGEGVVLTVDVYIDEHYEGGGIRHIPPYLLRMLINELNVQGAEEIAIDGQRVIATTAVREANDQTLVNGSWLSYFPIDVKVITEDPESLHHAMMSSQTRERFEYENLQFESETVQSLTVPAYDGVQRVRHMTPAQEG